MPLGWPSGPGFETGPPRSQIGKSCRCRGELSVKTACARNRIWLAVSVPMPEIAPDFGWGSRVSEQVIARKTTEQAGGQKKATSARWVGVWRGVGSCPRC